MSSLWTPGGERPVGQPDGGTGSDAGAAGSAAGGGRPPDRTSLDGDDGGDVSAEQVAAMRDELVRAPVEVVVANHCSALFELAAVYLSQQPPLLPQASLAIDALGCLVDGMEGRLGDGEGQLKDGLSQLRLAFVQISGANQAGQAAGAAAGVNGGRATPAPPDAGSEDAPASESGRSGSGEDHSPGGPGADTGE